MKKNQHDSMADMMPMQEETSMEDPVESSRETSAPVWTMADAFYVLCDAMAAHPVMEDNLALMHRLEEIRIWHINGNREVPWQHLVQILPQCLGFPVIPDGIR